MEVLSFHWSSLEGIANLGGALPVRSRCGIDKGEVGRGLDEPRVNMPLCSGKERVRERDEMG